jgi:uncharacterized protein YcaQ
VTTISPDEARFIALWSQGFIEPIDGATPGAVKRMGAARRGRLVHSMLRRLGAVQLDTISVLARSHELVAYARFGAIGRLTIEDAYWNTGGNSAYGSVSPGLAALTPRPGSFEYWSHAACILPVESWPLFAFRRRFYEQRGIRWHDVSATAVKEVLAQLADGPLATADIGGAKKGGEWWDWSDAKIALEWLLDIGTVVVAQRIGWRRIYDLAERAVPTELRETDLTDDECVLALIADGARTVGIGTAGDIADVHRVKNAEVKRHAADAGLVPVRVHGWRDAAWATPEALAWLASRPRATVRTTMLSPFDSLVWHRPRTERIFGMTHRLEAYTPAHKRVHGYFAMPVLHQGALVARVDPKRDGRTLTAKKITFEDGALKRDGTVKPSAIAGTAMALREAASWVGAEAIAVTQTVPSSAAPALAQQVASGG